MSVVLRKAPIHVHTTYSCTRFSGSSPMYIQRPFRRHSRPASISHWNTHKKILISMLIQLSFKSTTAGNDHGKRKEKLDKYNMQRNININMIQIPCKVCMIKTLYHSHQSFSLWWLGDFSLFAPLSFGTALSGCQSEGLSETGTWIEVGQS